MEGDKAAKPINSDYSAHALITHIGIAIALLISGFVYGFSRAYCNKMQIFPLSALGFTFAVTVAQVLRNNFIDSSYNVTMNYIYLILVPVSLMLVTLVYAFIPPYTKEENIVILAHNADAYQKIMASPLWDNLISRSPKQKDLTSRRFYVDFSDRTALKELFEEVTRNRSLYIVIPKDLDPSLIDKDIYQFLYADYFGYYFLKATDVIGRNGGLISPNYGSGRKAYNLMMEAIRERFDAAEEEACNSMCEMHALCSLKVDTDLEKLQAYANPCGVRLKEIHSAFIASRTDIDKTKEFMDGLISLTADEHHVLLPSEAGSASQEQPTKETKPEETPSGSIIIFLFFKSRRLREKIDKHPSRLGLTVLG